MSTIEHPAISRTLRTGYPTNTPDEPDTYGKDYFGEIIVIGEDIVEDGETTVLKHNLERYLAEEYGFEFKTIG
ncbi:hypothetical protein M3204_14110 [Mesobacillus subterraneus]|uniref:YqaI family protein n=1 Tax=Mesobacillus subterraneus TaxID=285983 RepID=UPI002040FF87|nr:hypothetical protein [Mesobacillus subterraneus]MCM3686107.1 hypothetical protein [Mesobacillus subterraneus]